MIAPAGSLVRALIVPVLAIAAALALGMLVMAATGVDPWVGIKALIYGAFGTRARVGVTITNATPLILAGLAVALPFRCGLLNIGGEGQIYMGALAGTIVALGLRGLPWAMHVPLVMAASFIGGAAWGAISGWLRARLKLNELITTIMLNYISFWIVSYLVHTVMKDPNGGGYPWTVRIPDSAALPIILAQYRINLGILVAVGLVAVAAFVLWKTCLGFEMRAVGASPLAARLAGIQIERTMVITLALGGGLAGLAGFAEVMGVQHRLSDFFSPGYGFDGLVVALVGQSNPAGVLGAAFFFGALRNGAESASRSVGLPQSIAQLLQALTLLFVIGSNSVVFVRMWYKGKQERAAGTRSTIPIH